MTPQFFIQKWRRAALTERAAAQSHFNDLCALLGEPAPTDADPLGDWFAFEKGARKTGGGQGWADVWKKGCFTWEYKGKHKDLGAALRQLQQYALALDNPPLLIVCDLDTIEIHTNFTNTVHVVHRLTLDDLADGQRRQMMLQAFLERLRTFRVLDPACGSGNFLYLALQTLKDLEHQVMLEAEQLGLQRGFPVVGPEAVSGIEINPYAAELARVTVWIGEIQWMLSRGYSLNDQPILKPLDQIFCRDALLAFSPSPDGRGARGEGSSIHPPLPLAIRHFARQLRRDQTDAESLLWRLLRNRRLGGFKFRRQHPIPPYILDFYCHEVGLALELDGSQHLEQQVQDEKRSALLADQGIRVLRFWNHEVLTATEAVLEKIWLALHEAPSPPAPLPEGEGSQAPSPPAPLPEGERSQAPSPPAPLPEGEGWREADWPAADVIVGNPPFLGGSKILGLLGEQYANVLRTVYRDRVPGGADLVCCWFEKARAQIESGKAQRAGLVATNSIRGGANRKVLERIVNTPLPSGEGPGVRAHIFNVWSDEDWVNEGAAVRVSLVCFGAVPPSPAGRGVGGEGATLDGQPVAEIYADLTRRELAINSGVNLTDAVRLKENLKVAFIGTMKKGFFDITGELARSWLSLPNPNKRSNSDVLFPWANGLDITRRPSDMWIVDFGVDMPESLAALYETPFQHIVANVKPQRDEVRNDLERYHWWLLARPAPDLRRAITGLARFIVTPRIAKYRLFAWLYSPVVCDGQLVVIACSDDTTFGILHSRFHELWALRLGTSLEDRLRYTPTTTFETFPFPEGLQPSRSNALTPDPSPGGRGEPNALTPDPSPGGRGEPNALAPTPLSVGEGLDCRARAIADAARRLVELRDNWLNPPEWVRRVPEVVPGYPDRLLPVDDRAAAELKKRTLTNLYNQYNQRPAWLANAHRTLASRRGVLRLAGGCERRGCFAAIAGLESGAGEYSDYVIFY